MMTLYLTRKVGTAPIPLSLPATPADIGNAFAKLDAICPAPSATEIYKVDSEVRNLNRYICKADVENRETLRKLNQLAELLQGMSREDQMKMEGVLDSNSINGMDDILNAASMVKEYVLLEEVDSDRTLGNYLVEHGVIDCPENIKPYLDYVGIGAEFYSDHGGAYTLNGYVVRKTELPPQLQPRKPFREESRDEMLRLTLRTGHHADYPLILPADEEYLSSVKKYLCIDEFAEAQIRDVRFKTPYIGQMIHAMECPSVEEYNEFAEALEAIWQTDGALLTYAAVLDAEQPDTLRRAYELLQDLDNYERIVEGTYEYGQQRLQELLELDHDDIAELDGYMDFERYGQDCMDNDHVVQTEFGLLRRFEPPFPEQSQAQQMKGL
ncbi:MAG: antirestriction protein ArdA [Candidatus Avoscillospira sp.]